MTNRFISDPRTVVKAGDIVRVKVIEVDKERRRIGLSMRFEQENAAPAKKQPKETHESRKQPVQRKKPETGKKIAAEKKAEPVKKMFNTAMADAFAKLKSGGS
jgi:uncharacterized protein